MKKCMLYLMGGLCLTVVSFEVYAQADAELYAVASKYGISPHLLRAVSIVETREGQYTGTHQVSEVVNAEQLKYLHKIARHTRRPLSDFQGSYAGAMGYMQIVPSTFFIYGQDGDGDGIKDPLNRHDSLATAAYFLARRFARTNSLKATLMGYNRSARYGKQVLAVYRRLQAEEIIASSK